MIKLLSEHLEDCSTPQYFCFSIRCEVCGEFWYSSSIPFSKAAQASGHREKKELYSFDENRESHVENNISTELESVTITDSEITFNFRSPAPFYLRSSETGNVWQAQKNVTSYTFGHSITNIEHCAAVYYGTEENPSATIGYNEYATSSFFEFFTKDDVNATRMILHMDAGHDNDVLAGIHNCYLEFNRQ